MSGRTVLIVTAALFSLVILALPLTAVFYEAFRNGLATYVGAVTDPETAAALWLTVRSALFALTMNLIFGLAAAWLVTHFEFRGKRLVLALIDCPLAVSPVIAGMVFVLVYGKQGLFGAWVQRLGFDIIFAEPGIMLVTTFVTLPLIVRELMPLMLEQGALEEEAALTMGASGYQVFSLITLPKIKWALLYGMILCNARAMGEFGAVSVVSGHIRGYTNTLPLQIEALYNEYQFSAAFAVASLLTLLALATLLIKKWFELRAGRHFSYEGR